MKTKHNHFGVTSVVSIISITSLAIWIHSVQAAPPGMTPKERRAMAELDIDIKVGMSYAEIQANTFTGPIIESTGFELSDGFDVADPKTGFNGFICGPEFIDCVDPDFIACPDPGGNCCVDDPNPDNGWYVSISSMHCKEPHIDNVNPSPYSGGEQHLRFERAKGNENGHYGPTPGCVSFGGACRQTAFSPDVTGNGNAEVLPFGPWTASVDIASTGYFSSNFVAFYIGEGGRTSVAAYIFFYNYGGIYILEYGSENFYFGRWNIVDENNPSGYYNLTVSVDPCNMVTRYYYDGDIILELSETSPNGVSGNNLTMNRAIFITDNAGQHWDVDNFSVERGDPCSSTCGAEGIEPGEECEFERVCFSGPNEGNPCVSDDDCGSGGSCLVGDHYCPGRCVPPGETGLNGEEECTCIIPGTDPCVATDLPNGTSDYITHGGWFTFVADTTATAIETCGSEGFDSYLIVLTNSDGSDDCGVLDSEILRNDDCGVCSAFACGDILGSCNDRAGPGEGPGEPWEACLCVPTTIGQRYWVWEYRGGEILNANIRITKTKRLTCGEVWENGTCCDHINGVCTDEVAPESCTGDFETFSLNKLCESPSVSCEPITGACCDQLDGFCSETIKSECSIAQPLWTPGKSCGEVVCDPAMGACCNTRLGTCTNNIILANCMGDNRSWTKGDSCNDRTCPDPFVPTVSHWGLIVLTLLLLIGGKIHFNRAIHPVLP